MVVDIETLIAAAIPTIGAIVWLVRLEGRVNVTDVRYSEIINRLERIEHKQDLTE